MSQTPDIVRLEGQLYDLSPHLRCENEILKQNRRRQLREHLQNSILKVELEKLDMDTVIKNSDNLFEKSQNLNVLSAVEYDSDECIPKPLQLSESSEDDGEYTRPLSVIKQLEQKEKQMQVSKYSLQNQQLSVPGTFLEPVTALLDKDDKTWTVGHTVRKRRMNILKQRRQNAKSFRGFKRDFVRGNKYNENGFGLDTPLTLSIRLPEVIREHRKKLEISIDLGRIDLSRQILGSELCCFNEEQHTQPTITNTSIEEIQTIENTTSSQQQHPNAVDETEDEKTLSHLISEVLVEPNAVETWRATNVIDNINNNIADNYNADLPCYADSDINNGKAAKRRKNSKKKPQGPPKKRGRKPGKKNRPKTRPIEVVGNQPKSDLAKYVELFSNNCELPGSTTPAASSTMSQLVTSTTQHLDATNEQPITYYIEGDFASGNCQLISTGHGDASQITHEDFNMTELVNYIDSSTTDMPNNVIARVLEGGNIVPVSVSLPSYSNVYSNNNSSNIIQLPTMKYVNAPNNSHQILSYAPPPLQCHTIATNMSMPLLRVPPVAHNSQGVWDLSKKSSSENHCSNIFTTNNSGTFQNYDSSDGPIDLSLKCKRQAYETVPQQPQITQQHIVVDDESDDNFIRRLIETSGIDFKPDANRNPSCTSCAIRHTQQQMTSGESFKAALDMPLLDMENSSQNVRSLQTSPSLIATVEQDLKGSNNLSLNTSLISGNNVFNNTIEFADQSSKELFERLLEVGDSENLDCEHSNDNSLTCKNPDLEVEGELNNLIKLFDTNNENSKEEFPAEAETNDLEKVDAPLEGNKVMQNDANVKNYDKDNMGSECERSDEMEKNTEDTDFVLDSSSTSSVINNTVFTVVEKAETEESVENKEVVTLDDIESKKGAEKIEIEEIVDNQELVQLINIESDEIKNELKTTESVQDSFLNEVNDSNDNNFLKCNSNVANERKVDIISVVHLDSFNWTKDADNAYIQRILSKVNSDEKPYANNNNVNNSAKDKIKLESNDLTWQNKRNHLHDEETNDSEKPTVSNVGKKEQPQVGSTHNIAASASSASSEDLLFVDMEDFQNKSFDTSLAVDDEKDPLSSTLESIAASIADTMTIGYLNKRTSACYSSHHKDSIIDLIEDDTRDDVNLELPMPKLTLLEKNSQEMESDFERSDATSRQKIEVYDVDSLQLSDKNNNDVVFVDGSREIANTNSEANSSRLSNVVDEKQNRDDSDNKHEQEGCLQLSEKSNNEIITLESSQNIKIETSKHAVRVSFSIAVGKDNDDLQLSEEYQDIKTFNVEGLAALTSIDADARCKNDETVFDCVVDDLQISEESQDIKVANDVVFSGSSKHSNDEDEKKDNDECARDCVDDVGKIENSRISVKTDCLVKINDSQDSDMSDVSSKPLTQNSTDVDEATMKDEIVCDCFDYDLQLSEESQDIKISSVNDPAKQNLNDADDDKQDNDEIVRNCNTVESTKTNHEVVKESQNIEISIDSTSPKNQNVYDANGKQDKDDHSFERDECLRLSDKTNNEASKESQDTEILNVDFSSSSTVKENLHDASTKKDNAEEVIDDEYVEEDKYLQLSHNTNNEVIKESQDIKMPTNISSSPTKPNVVDAAKYQHGSSITKDNELFPSLSILEMELKLDDICLDYDAEIEDDALSLATSCFNSPDEDRFSDSKVIEDDCNETVAVQSINTEKSTGSGSGIHEVISTEQISQSTSPKTKNFSNPKEQCPEKGGYFLRKLRIPNVICGKLTADCSKPSSMGKYSKQTVAGQSNESNNNETSGTKREHTDADSRLSRRYKIPKLSPEITANFSKSPAILCPELSNLQKSTEITTKKMHYDNIKRTVHNDCSAEATVPALNSAACTVVNVAHNLPPLTTTPAITFNIPRFQRAADVELNNYVTPPPAHLLAEYAKMDRGQFAGKGGEALNRGPATQHIAKIFGVTCLSYLGDKCLNLATCPFTHNFLDAALVKRRLDLLPPADVNAAYKFMYNHKQLFRRYFLEFCKVYTNQKNSNKLLNMVYDCERRSENVPFLRSIFYSLVKCGFSKLNACRHILSRSRDESKANIDTLVSMIVESDWTMFSDHIERFTKIKHYTFRFNDLNQMATTVMDAKDFRLSQVFFNCLLTIEPEELGLIQQAPVLLNFLKLIESGKMRQ